MGHDVFRLQVHPVIRRTVDSWCERASPLSNSWLGRPPQANAPSGRAHSGTGCRGTARAACPVRTGLLLGGIPGSPLVKHRLPLPSVVRVAPGFWPPVDLFNIVLQGLPLASGFSPAAGVIFCQTPSAASPEAGTNATVGWIFPDSPSAAFNHKLHLIQHKRTRKIVLRHALLVLQ